MRYRIQNGHSDYVIHSSGPWKKHKYLKKIGDGANAVYQYADEKIGISAGEDYRAYKHRENDARAFYNKKKKHAKQYYPNNDKESKTLRKDFVAPAKQVLDRATAHRKKSERDYEYSALGKVHKAHKRAARRIIKVLKRFA